MNEILRRFKGILIAVVALALSASLTFGAQAPAAGFAFGSSYQAGTNEANGDEDANEPEDTETDETKDESSDSADNCLTDPTTLTEEELAAASHGSIVCWAAHQTEWPAWFANHGKFVSCWAHQGKPDAPSCTEAPVAGATTTHGKSAHDATATHGKGKGSANHPAN